MKVCYVPRPLRPRFVGCLLIALVNSLVLAGCEPSNHDTKAKTAAPIEIKKYPKLTTLKGIVSSKDQTVFSGIVKVTTPTGKELASVILDNTNHYQVEIKAGTELPLVLSFHPKSTGETLTTAAVHPGLTQYDLNPFTTAIAKKALALGGYTHTNMIVAAESAVHVPDDNKTSSGWRGDPTKQYGGWH